MTEIVSTKLTNGAITEELGVYDLDSELHIICLDYDIMSPSSSTHHTTRLTYTEAWRLCDKIMKHIGSVLETEEIKKNGKIYNFQEEKNE